MITVVVMAEISTVEPTDRSMPPVMITAVMPMRDDADEGEVAGDVEQVVGRRERLGQQRHGDDGQNGREQDPEDLAADQPGQEARVGLLVDGVSAGRYRRSCGAPSRASRWRR